MSHYIALVNYTDKGIANVKDSPAGWTGPATLLREMGGEFRQVYLTMGGHDMVVVYEAPDDATAARFSLRLGMPAMSARPRSRRSPKPPTARSSLTSAAEAGGRQLPSSGAAAAKVLRRADVTRTVLRARPVSPAVAEECSMAYILAEVAGTVGTVTLDHERRRNALSRALVEEVIAALARLPRGARRGW